EAQALESKMLRMCDRFRSSDWEHWPDWSEQELLQFGLGSVLAESMSTGDARTAIQVGELLAARVPEAHAQGSLVLPWAYFLAGGAECAVDRARRRVEDARFDRAALPLEVLGDLEALRGNFPAARAAYGRSVESDSFIRSPEHVRDACAREPSC